MYSNTCVNFTQVWRGDTLRRSLKVEAYPLTAATQVRMQVRPRGDFDTEPVLSFSSEPGGGIYIDIQPDGNFISLWKTAAEMQAVRPGVFVYDCQFSQGGEIYTLFHGQFIIHQDITQ